MKSKLKNLIIPLILPVSTLFSPVVAHAQNLVPENLQNTFNIGAVLQAVIRFIIIAGFVIAFIMLIVGGIRWILAGGDEKAVASARGTITAALIGLVIVLVAYALIRLVEAFFGVKIITGGICIPIVGQDTGCANIDVDPFP